MPWVSFLSLTRGFLFIFWVVVQIAPCQWILSAPLFAWMGFSHGPCGPLDKLRLTVLPAPLETITFLRAEAVSQLSLYAKQDLICLCGMIECKSKRKTQYDLLALWLNSIKLKLVTLTWYKPILAIIKLCNSYNSVKWRYYIYHQITLFCNRVLSVFVLVASLICYKISLLLSLCQVLLSVYKDVQGGIFISSFRPGCH